MDNNNVAMLQDYQYSLEQSFKKIDKIIKEIADADQSQQNLGINSYDKELSTVKTNLGLMKMEFANLKESSNINSWKEKMSQLNDKYNSYKTKLSNIRDKKNNFGDDPLSIDVKADLSKMSSQEVINRGNKILEADRDAIARMKKTVSQDLETMKDVNAELLSQNERLENAEKDLKEIDYSLKRAGKEIKNMFKMYAKDKLIMSMIICILLVAIGIVICVFFFDGDDDANQQKDNFNNGD